MTRLISPETLLLTSIAALGFIAVRATLGA